jgi:TET-Associated Glycosyltransferase
MRIYVPSTGRAFRFGSVATSLDLIDEATLVVPGQEADRYRRVTENMMRLRPSRRYDVVACALSGIAATRRFIGEYAKKKGEKKFCMVDDDLMFAVRESVDGWQLKKADRDEVVRLFDWIEHALEDDVAHASVSARQSNNAFPVGDITALTKYCKRTLRVLAYQTAPFLAMEHGRVTVMEDFDVNLQLLRAGWRNATTYWWAQDQRGTGTVGGCSGYRTREAHDASARMLAELHPEFVKLRTKSTKSSSKELQERLEVTIQWEQAYKSSQKASVR